MTECLGFATGQPLPVVVVLLVAAACRVLRGWVTHRTAIRHEAEATRRVQLAVSGTSSEQRAAVVRACADHEAAARSVSRPRNRNRR